MRVVFGIFLLFTSNFVLTMPVTELTELSELTGSFSEDLSEIFSQISGKKDGATPFDVCDTGVCDTGVCAACNNECFSSKKGACASCWTVDQTTNTSCLSDTKPDCRTTCWKNSPCDMCRTGSCKRCEQCQDTKSGDCASCYEPDTEKFTCILDYQGEDCKGCWNIDNAVTPIVVVSGLTASSLQAVWKGVGLCKDSPTPTQIWPWTSLTKLPRCELEAMKVNFDEKTKTFHNRKGVNVSTVDFGRFDGLTFKDTFVGKMEQYGYRQGVNMFGLPFDWRYSAHELKKSPLYGQIVALIEIAYLRNKGRKVALVAPSYGPEVMIDFLSVQSQEWKDKYMSWFIADSPVWSGSPLAINAIVSGLPIGKSALLSLYFRGFIQQIPAMLWLSPLAGNDQYTFSKTEAIFSTPSKNYTAWDVAELLTDIGSKKLIPQFEFMQNTGALADFTPPMVNTWVNYGYDVPTANQWVYDKEFSIFAVPNATKTIYASGDGVVPLRSSLRSNLWEKAHTAANKTLIHTGYKNMAHAACLAPFDANHTQCYYDFLALLVNGTLPKPATPV